MNLNTFRPKYAVRRIAQERFWRQHPEAPWLAKSGIILLDSWLRPTDVGLEWGSGRSTAWFAAKTGKVTSIENYKPWYDKVSGMLRERGLEGKVDYRFVACEWNEIEEPETAEYVSTAESLGDGSVDYALVDGTVRATCMPMAMRKLKPGGLLILDNANRFVPNQMLGENMTVHEPRNEPRTKKWGEIIASLSSWRAIMTTDGIWDTRFWVKPG